MSGKFIRSLVLAGLISIGGYASAQQDTNAPPPPPGQGQPGGGGGGFAGGRGGRNFDPAQWRQQREQQMKERLGAKDDEWQVIQPRLEKVMTLSMQSRFSSMRGMFSRNRGGDNNASDQNRTSRFPGADSAVSRAQQDLASTLDDPNANSDLVQQKLKALRDARDASKQELTKAQSDLKEVLTPRQEAVLVSMGYLE